MPSIFLSYRKVDSRFLRERVYGALVDRFGADAIFRAGPSIPPGADFAALLRKQATECQLMLVLIGPDWLGAPGPDGLRPIDRPEDWVRVEIATALKAGNRVVPVLLGDAALLPAASTLPNEIAIVPQLQFRRVQETHLDASLERFCAKVAELLPSLDPGSDSTTQPSGTPAPGSPVTMRAHVSGGGHAFQAGHDQTVNLGAEA
jgi:hypothetical protein